MGAALEVERKFLVESVPTGLVPDGEREIVQGYLASEPNGEEVRLRWTRRNGQVSYVRTLKQGRGLDREEQEQEIEAVAFVRLWALTSGRRIYKTRRLYRLAVEPSGPMLELDWFDGRLKGLIVAEVEFPDQIEASGFSAPGWFGREVTGDRSFSNHALAERINLDGLR